MTFNGTMFNHYADSLLHLGVLNVNELLYETEIQATAFWPSGEIKEYMYINDQITYKGFFKTTTRGSKTYELTNHLGNVMSTISDRKIPVGSTITHFLPDVDTYQDYFPFGMVMSERSGSEGSAGYRYGFGGQEQDNELYGHGNSYTAEFWQYDTRLGRRWNVDPLTAKYPWQSPYAVFNNNPLFFNDPYGLEGDSTTVKGGDSFIKDDGSTGFATMSEVEVVDFASDQDIENNEIQINPSISLIGENQEFLENFASGGGLASTMWGEAFDQASKQKPIPQRGYTIKDYNRETKQFKKYAKGFRVAGNIMTGLEATLALTEFYSTDGSYGDVTKLGVRLGIVGLGQVRHPVTISAAIALGFHEQSGGFDDLYWKADFLEETGILLFPTMNGAISIPIKLW